MQAESSKTLAFFSWLLSPWTIFLGMVLGGIFGGVAPTVAVKINIFGEKFHSHPIENMALSVF